MNKNTESKRDEIKKSIKESLRSSISEREIETHFSSMPERYWDRVSQDDLVCHLEMQHAYLTSVDTPEHNIPVIRWRHHLESDYSEVVVMTWNRHGLLAKMAGAFAAVDMNVFEAEIYTREDGVVLDVFRVCDSEYRRIKDKVLMDKVLEILTKSLSKHGDLPFDEMSSVPSVETRPVGLESFEPKVEFDNNISDRYTVLSVRAKDHVGLLHDILQVLALSEVDIEQAKILTEEGVAMDTFYIIDASGKKITDTDRLNEIKPHLLEMIEAGRVG